MRAQSTAVVAALAVLWPAPAAGLVASVRAARPAPRQSFRPPRALHVPAMTSTAKKSKNVVSFPEATPAPGAGVAYGDVTIGVVRELEAGENRVGQSPESAKLLTSAGFKVCVESGAGLKAGFADSDYEAVGCTIAATARDAWASDLVVKINPPSSDEATLLGDRALLSFVQPRQNEDLVKQLGDQGATVLAMDCIPRTLSRGQAFDALSSQANIAGYRAVIEAAHAFGRLFTGQMTAAGKVAPAKVLVLGAGVAGLAAIQTAKNMGAQVYGYDVRPVVQEQVEAAGGIFLKVDFVEDGSGAGGYAKEMSDEYKEAERAMLAKALADADVVITTALIPGRPAPRLVNAEALATMRRGSVLVDMAAVTGGNVEGSVSGERVGGGVDGAVSIIGYSDLPSRLPATSSNLYGRNAAKFVLSAGPQTTGEKGRLLLDYADPAVRGMLVGI